MSDTVECTDGIYANQTIEELPYERADENDYHLKFSETQSLEDEVPLLVPLLVPKRTIIKKPKKKTKKQRKNPRAKKTRIKSFEPSRVNSKRK